MSVGIKIKELRNSQNLTQEQLAEKSSLSKNAIWNYENEKRTPNIEILDKIATALGVTIESLLGDDETFIFNDDEIKLINYKERALESVQNIINYACRVNIIDNYALTSKETELLLKIAINTLVPIVEFMNETSIFERLKKEDPEE